jgi:hypothetical protein
MTTAVLGTVILQENKGVRAREVDLRTEARRKNRDGVRERSRSRAGEAAKPAREARKARDVRGGAV